MHLLCLNPVGSIGGAEKVLLQLLQGVASLRPEWKVTLLTMTDGPLLERAAALGARAISVAMPPALAGMGDSQYRQRGKLAAVTDLAGKGLTTLPQLVSYIRRLRSVIRKLAPTLVHSNGIKSHLLSRFVAGHLTRTWHLHDYFSLRPLMGKLLRKSSTGVEGTISISRSVAKDAEQVLPKVPSTVILNSVDTVQFSPGIQDSSELDRLANLPVIRAGSLLRVGLIATYALWKGHRLFLEVAKELTQRHPEIPVRFYIIGGGIYHTKAQWTREALESLTQLLGIQDRVGFIPFQTDPAPIYRALDVVVHASTQPEPFGLTIAEAMACGRPVLVSNGGGASELFSDGVDAIGFTPGNSAEMLQGLLRLLRDAELRQRLSIAARDTAVKRFSSERFAHEVVDFFTSIIRSKTR